MLQTKALYNLLRLNVAEDPTIQAEPWALENMRSIPIEELYSRLNKYKIVIDRKTFVHFAEECDTPEELTDLLLPDEATDKSRDSFYLIIFELWRRLVPEKQSLSVFCDELDHRIALYDEGSLENDELVQDALANLLEVVDENADMGVDPQDVLSGIADYCAHDLESFIYDYVSDLLDSGNALYAAELIEGFTPYVTEPLWFDFLRIRLIAYTDSEEANLQMGVLLKQELEWPLVSEILRFLSANGAPNLFKIAAKKALPLLSDQEELQEVIRWTADFYRRLDEDDKEKAAQKLVSAIKPGSINSSDLKAIEVLITKE